MAYSDYTAYLSALKGNFIKRTRLDFLNPDGKIAFSIDNNYKNKRSRTFLQSGEISVNLQNGQRRTATAELYNADGEYEYNVNKLWFGQQIRIMEGLLLPDGTDFLLPQGVFYVKDPEEVYKPIQKTVSLNLVDKWSYLDGTLFGYLEGIYEVPLNSNMFNVITSILQFDRGNGMKIDDTPPVYTDYYNGKTTALPNGTSVPLTNTPYTYRNDSTSGTYADVILEMNKMLAGWIGYDATGALRLDTSADDLIDADKAVLYDFTPLERQFLGATYTVKNSEVFNDIIIRGESLDEYSQVGARAENLDPASDTNVNMIGRKTMQEEASGYYTTDICEALAKFRLKRNTILQRSVDIEATQIFHLNENNLVTIRRLDKPGAPTERHLINGFSRPLAGTGAMTISATSVLDFPVATITRLPGA